MDITNEQLLDLVDSTMKWATEVSELWTGTLYGKQIDLEKERLFESVRSGDTEQMKTQVTDLAQFLNQAEEEYERAEELQKVKKKEINE